MKNLSLRQVAEQKGFNLIYSEDVSYSMFSNVLEKMLTDVINHRHELTDFEKSFLECIIQLMQANDNGSCNMSQSDSNLKNIQASFLFLMLFMITLGGILGGIFGGNWQYATFGSVVLSTSLFLFYRFKKSTVKRQEESENNTDRTAIQQRLVSFCESIDKIAKLHEEEISEAIFKEPQNEEQPFERKYDWILSHIQSVIGYGRYKRGASDYTDNLRERCEDLVLILSNIQLKFVDYNGSNDELFDMVEDADAREITLVLPSVLKDDELILKGKVFIPENN